MHLAFKQAVKRRVIPTNPCDQADRPKAVQYIGTYYNSAEIKQLLECLEGDPMKIAVILTAYYGLRRSEVLGLKWDAIDPVEDKIYIRHKIIENKLNGNEIEGLDVMKTKSSYRSLPLMPFIKKALEEEKARQEEMQRVLRKSYNRKYLDYVCVDAMGGYSETTVCHRTLQGDSRAKRTEKDPIPRSKALLCLAYAGKRYFHERDSGMAWP